MTKKDIKTQLAKIDEKLHAFIQEEIELKDEMHEIDYLHDDKEFVHYEGEFTRIQNLKNRLTKQKNWLITQLERKIK